jgi:UDP-glucose 4-epimerase
MCPTNTSRFNWHDKKVLVTGASGFLGMHLLTLLHDQAEIIALSRSVRTNSDSKVYWRQIDLTDLDSVREVVGEFSPNVIFHLSSLANGSRDVAFVKETFEAEVQSTLNILLACERSRAERLVLLGSLEEPEAHQAPSSPYAAAKATSRLYARMFHMLYHTPVVMTRLFMCYGPGQPHWKIIPYLISCFQRGEAPVVLSPDRAVDWIYASDACNGLLAAAAAVGVEGACIDIGSGELVSIRIVTEKIQKIMASDLQPGFSSINQRLYEEVKRADVESTARLIGWRARTSLDEGLLLTVASALNRI